MIGKGKKKDKKKFNDPVVIDDQLMMYCGIIRNSVREYLQENKIIQMGSVNLAHIKQLSLSFKSCHDNQT